MAKILILLTMTYPFGKEETFLANEFEAINSSYDKIYVFSLAVPSGFEQNYKLSEKWKVFKKNENRCAFIKRLKYVLEGLQFYHDARLREEIEKNANTIIKKIVAIYYYGRLMAFEKFIMHKLKTIIIDKDDCIIIYSFWLLQTAHCATLLKKYFTDKIDCDSFAISRAHGYDLYDYRNKANYLPFREYLIRELDMVFPCSLNGKKYLEKEVNGYNEKIVCSYLGTFNHGRNPLSVEAKFIIVTCSHIIAVKRLNLLAEALVMLEQKGISEIQWLCIGDGGLIHDLKNYCSRNIESIEIKFLGNLQNESVFEIYKKQHIDIFINTSSSEGLPVSIMEAQSMGIPVIATDVGGTSEIVNSDNGILLSRNPSPGEIAQAILDIKEMQKKDIVKMREKSYKNWGSKFNAKYNYSKFHKFLINNMFKNKNIK